VIYCHAVLDKRDVDADSDDGTNKELDATALNMSLERVLIPSSAHSYPRDESRMVGVVGIGCSKVATFRNKQKDEIVAGMYLDGTVRIWHRFYDADDDAVDDDVTNGVLNDLPTLTFSVDDASGTSIELLAAPTIYQKSSGYTTENDYEILVVVGCRNGSVQFVHTGLYHGAILPNDDKSETRRIKFSKEAGTLFNDGRGVGSGQSCVTSVSLSSQICSSSSGVQMGVGRKDGIVDLYRVAGGDLQTIVRTHRILRHAGPVRAGVFVPSRYNLDAPKSHKQSEPNTTHQGNASTPKPKPQQSSGLFVSGGDDKMIYVHDVHPNRSSTDAALVKAYTGHLSWILRLSASSDGRRIASSSADKTIKIWDLGLSSGNGLVHTFDTGHVDMVWGVDFDCLDTQQHSRDEDGKVDAANGGGVRLASCGDDGMIHIYSTNES